MLRFKMSFLGSYGCVHGTAKNVLCRGFFTTPKS
nr:MAG TPA: hypothetical protein [Caudoviricetes sp.]